jgi:hypothetical protein
LQKKEQCVGGYVQIEISETMKQHPAQACDSAGVKRAREMALFRSVASFCLSKQNP